jgi:hypothetical protein
VFKGFEKAQCAPQHSPSWADNMQNLTPAGQTIVHDLANRYGLSQEAVVQMLIAVNNGGGTMAQFYCPELGGGGQWMRGGMTMVGDMFNHGLKNTVDNLCHELSDVLANTQIFPVAPPGSGNSSQWWPGDLGLPFSSGGQNNIRYAVFPQRLAVERHGQVTVYDTLNHSIGGVSQQQGGDSSLSFSSQFGTIAVSSLPVISGPALGEAPPVNFAPPVSQNSDQLPIGDIVALIEKLARLRDSGALTESEFNTKKAELLSRI